MNTIIPWLEHLNVLMPPRNIALVGAGNGKGIWAQWLAHQASKSRVTLIEAEPLQYATLRRTLDLLGERAQHCEIRNTVVAAQQGTASFFVANSQQESGLLEPRSLLSLWPNLQTEEVKELSAITLDALFSDLSEDAEQPMGEGHWLVIDCLPAGALLRASSKLDLVDVVIARVLLGEMHAMPEGTSLEEVAEFLQQKGMVQIAVEATRHPDIGYALFVRDARAALHVHHNECQKLRLNGEEQAKLLQEFQAQVGQLTQTKAAAEKRSQKLALQLEQLGQALEKQSRLAQERLSQTEQLTQAKLIVETQSQERVQQLEQLAKARDEQTQLAQERLTKTEQLTQAKAVAEKQSQERAQQLEQLTKARDEQAKLAQERRAQIELLTQAKTAAEKQLQERAQQLEQLGKARDEQAQLAQARQAQIEQLTQAKAAAEKQSQERAQQLAQLTKARDEQAKLAQERHAQIEPLTQAKAAAEKQSQERAQQLAQLTKARDEQAKLAQERHAQIEQLTQAKAAAEKQSQERAQQLEQLTKARDEQAKLAQERHAQIEQLTQAKAAAEKQSQERVQQLEQLTKARDEQAKLAQERHAQIEQLTQAKAAAEKQSQERAQQLEQLTKARDEQAKLAQERHAQIEQLTQAKAAAEKQSLERGQQLEQLAKARDEEAIKMRQEYKAQIEQLTLTNTPSEKTNSNQKDEIDALTKSLSEEKNLNRSWKLGFQDIEKKNIDLGKKSDQLRKSLEELQSKYEKEKKYSSDADIDDFLNDISPFFYNRSLTYVDVGAYIGEVFLKIHKSKLLRVREAHLFEPNPVSYKDLEKNVLEVNLTKLHTYNHALGAEDKELSLSPAKSMSKVFPSAMHIDQSKRIENTECHNLDGLVDLFTDRHIDLLKIDVEGYELNVLRGAEKIFEEQLADVIYIEAGFRRDGTQQTYFGDIDNFFQSYGYRIFKIYEQKNEWIQDSPLLRRCNIAYMSSAFSSANPFKLSQELMELKERLKKNNASHEDK